MARGSVYDPARKYRSMWSDLLGRSEKARPQFQPARQNHMPQTGGPAPRTPIRERMPDDAILFDTGYRRSQAPPPIVDPRQEYPYGNHIDLGDMIPMDTQPPPPEFFPSIEEILSRQPLPEIADYAGRIDPRVIVDPRTRVQPPSWVSDQRGDPRRVVDPRTRVQPPSFMVSDQRRDPRRVVDPRQRIQRSGLFGGSIELMREAINMGLLDRLRFKGF